jgi:acyl-CoA-binding protein
MSDFYYYFDLINRIPLLHTSDDFVYLSALYHQAILGDNTAPKPPIYDAVGCERWMQWTKLKGMSKDMAMKG